MRCSPKALITLASPFLGLLLVEAALRLSALESAPRPVARGVLFRLSLVPGLTFENRPGAVRTIEYRDHPETTPWLVEHRINDQGFRGPLTRPPVPGVFRIACIGDSHTFGAGVEANEAWPSVLGQLTEGVEVMNCGVNAYDTRREVLLLRERVLEYEPDMVLLQYHVNDVYPRNALGWKPAFDDWLWQLSAPDRAGWIGALRNVSRVADVSLDRIHASRGARDESGLDLGAYAGDAPGWLGVCAGLREARDLLERERIAFGVVLFPTLLPHEDTLSSHRAFAQVRDFCERERIPVYDGEPALLERARGRSIADLRVHAHDAHAGPEAHATFAAGVRDWLRSRCDFEAQTVEISQ